MASAVRRALDGRKAADPQDAGAEALALSYAGLMDEAAPAGKYRKALAVLRRTVAGVPTEEDDPDEAFALIETALAQHSVASDLGPKLLAVLSGLGLTPAARGSQKEGGKPDVPSNPLDQLRRKRVERQLSIAQQ